jgi:hypothetical protein
MKIENVMIKRRQIVFSASEFADINSARLLLRNALQLVQDDELQRAAKELENILCSIEIQDNDYYYIFDEKILENDA